VLASAVRDALGGRQDVTALPLTPARVRAMAESASRADRRERWSASDTGVSG
jgi:hypothetical protein